MIALSIPPIADQALVDAWVNVLNRADKSSRAWLDNSSPYARTDSTVIVAVPNDFTRSRIESRLRVEIEDALSEFYGRPMQLALTIQPDLELALEVMDESAFANVTFVVEEDDEKPQFIRPAGHTLAKLNPRYTFDNFVTGESNRFAHAAAVAVAEAPANSYNPLLIYGESGLGKTHILQAVGHYVQNYYPQMRVKYVSTEEMTNEFINSISENKTREFRQAYRDVDVLLIDDIQFLVNKIQTQEEFFHTFNALYDAQKQIVMTSDRPPRNLEALEPRLRSRFEMGLITDVQPPDLETRIAILRRKANAENLQVPAEVLELIGSRIQTNIRELEGALIRITAYSSLNREIPNLEVAEHILQDLIPGSATEISPARIMNETASFFGVTVDDLLGNSRTKQLATARQIAMYLCRELTELSLPRIGEEFGGKDHTTVLYAERKISQLMTEDRMIFNNVTDITNRLRQVR